NFEVIVIDNASTDSTKEWFEKEKYQFPNLTYISLDENIGFGPAVNIGFRNSKGKYLVVLNNDTLVSPQWLSNLLEFMGEDPSIGIISPVTNYVGEGLQIDEDAINMSSRLDFITDYATKISMRKELIYEPNRLVFFCVVIRRDLIDLIGYLDENYIKGNFEDDDYCMRARLAGYKLAIAKNSFVYHKGSITFKINQISHTQYMQTNREKFFLKVGRLSTSFYPTKYSNNKKGELSVIVRTKDRPVLLKNALNSLANQTYRGFEVVLVNDGGVDVKDLVEKFSDFFPIKYFMHDTPKGRTAAINTGLTNARGKWIAYLDDDDILYPWHFESLLSVHDLSQYNVIYGDYNRALFLDQTCGSPLKLMGVPPWEFNKNEFLIGNYIPIHSYIHLKECIDSIGFWNESLNRLEDYEFLLRLASLGNFRHVKKVIAEYRVYLDVDNSITGDGRSEYLNSLEYIYNLYPVSDESIRTARETAIQALRDQIHKIQEITNRCEGIEARYEIMKIVFGF
ncbi:MAG: glycosyltransferase family 2 protein, partial [Bacteroidota bacterium]